MKSFKARGIVLRERPVGESDKYVDLMLEDIGKLSVSARGARKQTSKFLAGTEQFTYADFVIYNGRKFYTMSQIDIIESFYGLRSDYDKFCYGSYFLEICDKAIIPGDECDDVLKLLLKTLSVLSNGKVQAELAARVFEIKFLHLSGYTPELKNCSVCGESLWSNIFFYSDGCVCRECSRNLQNTFPVTRGLIEALSYIENADNTNMFSFKAGRGTLDGLKRAFEIIFNSHINVMIKSRENL